VALHGTPDGDEAFRELEHDAPGFVAPRLDDPDRGAHEGSFRTDENATYCIPSENAAPEPAVPGEYVFGKPVKAKELEPENTERELSVADVESWRAEYCFRACFLPQRAETRK
jgi:hypothetical protein